MTHITVTALQDFLGATDTSGIREQMYRQGEIYELPMAVAESFLCSGLVQVDDVVEEPETDETEESTIIEPEKPTKRSKKTTNSATWGNK